jgi:uncharacterized protein YhfF
MEQEHSSVKEMWKSYVASAGADDGDKAYTSWYFCDNEKDADNLAELVKRGIKRATTSLYNSYQIEGSPLPKIGDISIITNWDGIAQCVIETKRVTILPFKEVTEKYAQTEGEGDKSLKYWREAHIRAFTRELREYNMKFSEEMLVVCEEFETVYK